MTIQCAWCNAEQLPDGTYGPPRATLNLADNVSHSICDVCRAGFQSIVRRAPAVVFCPSPEFDLGTCYLCGRTTVDHLVDRDNVAALNNLRSGTGSLRLSPVYRTRAA